MNNGNLPLDELLCQLRSTAALDLERGCSSPPGIYTSNEFAELERQRLFAAGWHCVGRVDDVPSEGDYVTFDIADSPVFAVRGADQTIRAFSNICLHRLMKLLDGSGNCRRGIVCPYHAWTYDISGQLRGAPNMNEVESFNVQTHRLREVQCCVWLGFIYVSLDVSAAPLGPQLAGAEQIIGRYCAERYVSVSVRDRTWNTNWKLLAENFMESYHLFQLHKSSVGKFAPRNEMVCPPGEDAYNIHWLIKKTGTPTGNVLSANTHLTDEWRSTSVQITVYPAHLITIQPDHLWYLSLTPAGVDQVHIRYGIAFAPELFTSIPDEEARQRYLDDYIGVIDQVNEEDRYVVETLCYTAKSAFAAPGRLSHLERPNHEFMRYLVRQMT